MKIRTASVKWHGSFTEGRGEISTESGALNKSLYSSGARFEQERGTNPEELIAAAHAACYSMSLAVELRQMSFIADFIKVVAQVKLESLSNQGWKITHIHLNAEAAIPGCAPATFEKAANAAKINCLVSQLLNVNITLAARLITLNSELFEGGSL